MLTFYTSVCTKCSITIQNSSETGERLRANLIKCKGQGEWYAKNPVAVRTSLNHVNFGGAFEGLCCFCAFHSGWHISSLNDAGCLRCKNAIVRYTVFMEIKRSKKFWADLPQCVLAHILRFVVKGNRKVPEKAAIGIDQIVMDKKKVKITKKAKKVTIAKKAKKVKVARK